MVRPAEAAVTGRRRTHSRRCRPPLAGRACDRHVRASRNQERLEPARGGLNPGPSAPAAPFYGGPLSAPSRPARREPAPPARAANRAWPRPGHAAPLESRDPQGGGKGLGLLAAPLRGDPAWPLYSVIWISGNRLCCGRPTTGKASTCSSSRSSQKDPRCRAPGCLFKSHLSASRELGAPRHPGARGQGLLQHFSAVVARVPGARPPTLGQPSSPPRAGLGFWGRVKGLVWNLRACATRSLSHGGGRLLLPSTILGPPPPRSVGSRRSHLCQSTARPLSRPESPRPQPPPPAGSGAASPASPSNGEARTPSAPGRLLREGARPPPRLHPLGGDAAIWGPC
nr:basic salivary proline-rich protein 4-like [Manis javanica]